MARFRVMAGHPHPTTGKPWGMGTNVEADSPQAAVDQYRKDEAKAARETAFFMSYNPPPVFAVYELVKREDWK